MRKIIYYAVLLVLASGGNAMTQETRELYRLDLPNGLAERRSFQFSSMVIKGDTMILAAEKCLTLYFLCKDSKMVISSQPIDRHLANGTISEHNTSIEGMALFKNRYLYLLDERATRIYCYDLLGEQKTKIVADRSALARYDDAIEGIAIDENNSLCFVLPENKRRILVFNINADRTLSRRNPNPRIYLPDDNWKRRTDLLYSDGKFYVLSTDFDRSPPAHYAIDIHDYDRASNTLVLKKSIVLDACNNYSPEYETNLEGLAMSNDVMYVISDNHRSNSTKCVESKGASLSLLFKFLL